MANKGLTNFLSKAFDIREGETGRALLMLLNIFLIILTLLIIKPTVNGLFVSRFGAEGLPKAYLLVAVFAVMVATLYSRLMSRSSLQRMVVGTFIVNVIVLVLFGLFLQGRSTSDWVMYMIYVYISVFGVFSASQFWIMANVLFNIREAKRLFGFIGAGAIAGGILGGYITKFLAPLIGSENMFFVSAALLFLCVPITLYTWKKYIRSASQVSAEKKQLKRHLENPLALIRRSKHLTFLALIIGTSVIVAKLVDYQYSDVAVTQIPDKDELSAFFGFWFSNFSIISLLIQLFFIRKLLSRLGIGGSLTILPGGILLGALALLFFPELWAAVLIKGADASLKQTVNKAGIELLGIPIPIEVKKRTKTFIDVVVDSIATGIGGLILIFLVHGLNLNFFSITLMVIFLVILWGYFVLLVRNEYLESFRINILNLRPDKKPIALQSKALTEKLLSMLREENEQETIWALQQVCKMQKDQFFEPCRKLLEHSSPAVRAEALNTLSNYPQKLDLEKVWKMTRDPDSRVKIEAFEYLIFFDHNSLAEIRDHLIAGDYDFSIQGPVFLTMAAETRDNPKMRQMLGVEPFIRERWDQIKAVKDPAEARFRKKMLAQGIGTANIPETFYILEELFKDPDPEVRNNAIVGAGLTEDPQFIKPLTEFLASGKTRKAAIKALVQYGPIVLDHLNEIIDNPAANNIVVQMTSEVAERLETPEAVDYLFRLCDHYDQGIQIEALRSLTDLKRNFPEMNINSKLILSRILQEARLYQDTLSILYAQQTNTNPIFKEQDEDSGLVEARNGLIHLLENRLSNHIERIFRLLSLRYATEDFTLFFKGIQQGKKEIQANTIEFLENLLHPNLKRVIIPIVESAMTESITQDLIDRLKLNVPQEFESFQMLLKTNDLRLKLSIFYLFEQIGDTKYLPLIEPFRQSTIPKVRDYANRVYNEIRDQEQNA